MLFFLIVMFLAIGAVANLAYLFQIAQWTTAEVAFWSFLVTGLIDVILTPIYVCRVEESGGGRAIAYTLLFFLIVVGTVVTLIFHQQPKILATIVAVFNLAIIVFVLFSWLTEWHKDKHSRRRSRS